MIVGVADPAGVAGGERLGGRARQLDPVKLARAVEGLLGGHGYPLRPALDQVVATVGAGHDEKVRRLGVGHGDLHRGDRTVLRLYLRTVGRPPRALVPHRQGTAELATGERGQPALVLRRGARRGQQQRGADVGEQRRGREGVAHLLGDHHQLDRPEPQAVVLLGDDHARPSENHQLVPLLVGEAALIAGQLADGLGLVARREKVPRGALDRLLIVGELEVHRPCPRDGNFIASWAARARARPRCS
jgi:hypothetical protein